MNRRRFLQAASAGMQIIPNTTAGRFETRDRDFRLERSTSSKEDLNEFSWDWVQCSFTSPDCRGLVRTKTSFPARLWLISVVCAMLATATAFCSQPAAARYLQVSENHRFLVRQEGQAFFWLGDTAWELFHRLNKAETRHYLETRARQGFNVVQCVLLAERDGLTVPTPEGHLPLVELDPTRPNESYFKHVDWVAARAAELDVYLAILPTWGANVHDPVRGRAGSGLLTPETARKYGRFLGRRYKERWNIIWVLGGDRIPTGRERIWSALADGLREGDGGKHLMTYHVSGSHSSSEYWHQAAWLDFNMIQSGHPPGPFSNNYDLVHGDYEKKPAKPTLDGEPLCEGMPMGFIPNNGRATAHHIRANAYWAVFAGACGHTYGANGVFQMMYPDDREWSWWANTDWRKALHFEGATQMRHLKNLLLSRPFLRRIPDQQALEPVPVRGVAHPQLTRDGTPGKNDATYLMVYYPFVTWTAACWSALRKRIRSSSPTWICRSSTSGAATWGISRAACGMNAPSSKCPSNGWPPVLRS